MKKTAPFSLNKKLAGEARRARQAVLRMIQHAGSGNPGSALSCVEILTWLLLHQMRLQKSNPRWSGRDRLVLSKGHAAPVFYALASRLGWVAPAELLGYRGFETRLQTHPEYGTLPCVDYTSGSLGQGLSAANGMALAARYLKAPRVRFFVLLGDGELQEGQVWEAAMTAGAYQLDRVCAIVDRNRLQGDHFTDHVQDIEPLAEKWRAFRWQVATADGHDFRSLDSAYRSLKKPLPKLIIAETVKGKGVSFMEATRDWHVGGKKFTPELLKKALREVGP